MNYNYENSMQEKQKMLLKDIIRGSEVFFGVNERLSYRSHIGAEIGR